MAFINRYTKPDSLNYYHSQEFTEIDRSFILAVGTTSAKGLVTKIDGNAGWLQVY